VAQNADEPFVPASVEFVTAWLALQVLGGDYRFDSAKKPTGVESLFCRVAKQPYSPEVPYSL
jgi:D-alanyl-D-alanine carboxypeptidase/D-alanyl-D-alanine-endopeptidase (penicillin-binding protein 4)